MSNYACKEIIKKVQVCFLTVVTVEENVFGYGKINEYVTIPCTCDLITYIDGKIKSDIV